MKSPLLRSVAFTALLGVSSSSLGCGYILHPERRGHHGGTISGTTLVLDCLWLLVFIVPGVVFLVVDFTSGAMYVSGGGVVADATGKVKVKVNDSKEAKTLRLRVVDTTSNLVLDERVVQVGPSIHDKTVEFDLSKAPHKAGKVSLQIVDDHQPNELLQSLSFAY
jgi:hypothetical protein